ncbi:hypothetical protein T4E_9644 [Trichinella pseudospiralis]|uniref:Uncharacterized protein n=1 Tax=Trichinella pseudospiralis TaxID=6337 RepID=A0A0V0XW55_TRIPS|nr:hypothetical protein T4E_9644 [Trichinella pseudospiralis]KRY83886.1 hypothetical protein T4D_7676 [Trichinella pseudospiralis]
MNKPQMCDLASCTIEKLAVTRRSTKRLVAACWSCVLRWKKMSSLHGINKSHEMNQMEKEKK